MLTPNSNTAVGSLELFLLKSKLSMNPLDLKTKKMNIIGETDVAYASLDAKNYAKEIGFSKGGSIYDCHCGQ